VGRYVLRIPVVLSLVGRSDVIADLSGPQRVRAELLLRIVNEVVVNSSYYLRGSRFSDSARIIPYGVDLVRFQPGIRRREARRRLGLTDEDFVILAVQRLEPLKRVDLLIRMMADVLREVPLAILVVTGTGSEEQRLTSLADELGVAASVRFTGYVAEEQLPAMFGLADLYATHSQSETFGVTFAEAMATGLPIVAADTSCVRDVLTNDTAAIVEPGDLHAFAAALVGLAHDPGGRSARAAAGRERAEREFDWRTITDSYEQVMIRCVQAQRRTSGQ